MLADYTMHRCLNVSELVGEIAELVMECGRKRDLVSLAITSHTLTETVLTVLWKQQQSLVVLFKCFPADMWRMSRRRGMLVR